MTRDEPSGDALLAALSGPEDLRRLSPCELPSVARALRDFLVRSVARSGGHLAAGLGTVELTVALHYIYAVSYTHLTLPTNREV